MTDPAILAFIAEQNAQRGQAGVAPDGDGPGGGGVNGVVGEVSASLRGGYNSVILNGGRSQYLLAVDGDGALTLHNAVSGQASHITGASYVLFDGAQTTAPGQYASFLLIADAADSAIAALYQAGFGRVPDFPGLEYWENAYAQGLPLAAIAVDFAQSAEFTRKFGSATGMSATGFATLL